MSSLVNEIIQGRKTFFIAPDKSLFPESYLEDYLALGYECYFVDTDIFLSISAKVEIILSVFQDALIFFSIDSPLQNDSWPNFISRLQKKYPRALFGVLYAKKQSNYEKEELERLYLMDIGIQCGCIQLEYQKKNNFSVLERVLFANQAMGRRKSVRACCNGFCSIKFSDKNNQLVNTMLNDISLSHFTIQVNKDTPTEIKDYEKIYNIQFFIKGLHFVSDAVLFSSRQIEEGTIYVFAFSKTNGQLGLDTLNRQLLIPKLCSIMENNLHSLLSKLFNTASQRMRKEK